MVKAKGTVIWISFIDSRGFSGGSSGKEPASQCRRRRRCRFNPWVWKILWRSSILAWELYGQRSLAGYSPWVARVRHYLVTKKHNRHKYMDWKKIETFFLDNPEF